MAEDPSAGVSLRPGGGAGAAGLAAGLAGLSLRPGGAGLAALSGAGGPGAGGLGLGARGAGFALPKAAAAPTQGVATLSGGPKPSRSKREGTEPVAYSREMLMAFAEQAHCKKLPAELHGSSAEIVLQSGDREAQLNSLQDRLAASRGGFGGPGSEIA